MKYFKALVSLIFVVLLSGSLFSCASMHEKGMSEDKLVKCARPRPEVCTKEYRPVCGFEPDGNHKTFSNACSACASTDIISYCGGNCK